MSAPLLKDLAGCVLRKQSDRLAKVLSLRFDATISESDVVIDAQSKACFSGPLQAYAGVMAAFFKAKRLEQQGKFQQAYDEQIIGFKYA